MNLCNLRTSKFVFIRDSNNREQAKQIRGFFFFCFKTERHALKRSKRASKIINLSLRYYPSTNY